MVEERLNKLWQEIDKGIDKPATFLVLNPKNIFYLTQFQGEGILLATPEQNYLITDSRYEEQAKQEALFCETIIQDLKVRDSQTASLANLLSKLRIDSIGFEADYLPVSIFSKYQRILPQIKFIPLINIIEQIRIIKDLLEIELLTRAAEIASNAFLETIEKFHDGVSEQALASLLNYNIRKAGASKESFDLIVTSGERGTLVHGQASDKQIRKDDLVIFDFGCIYKMYNSDCTRTLSLGELDKERKQLFNIIKEVQLECLERVKAGAVCFQLDQFARSKIEEKGYGKYFNHSLGHGVGLDIHEMPRLGPNDQTILLPGMVITIEPGIYIPGLGGVRIEDTVLVTDDGYVNLSRLPKQLLPKFYFEKRDC